MHNLSWVKSVLTVTHSEVILISQMSGKMPLTNGKQSPDG